MWRVTVGPPVPPSAPPPACSTLHTMPPTATPPLPSLMLPPLPCALPVRPSTTTLPFKWVTNWASTAVLVHPRHCCMADSDAAFIGSFARVFLHGGAADAGSASLLRHLLTPGSYAGAAVGGPPMPPGFIAPVQNNPPIAGNSNYSWPDPAGAWNAYQQQHFYSQQYYSQPAPSAPSANVAAPQQPRVRSQPQMSSSCKGAAQSRAAEMPAASLSNAAARSPPQPKQARQQPAQQAAPLQPLSPPAAPSLNASPAIATAALAVGGAAIIETPMVRAWPREQGDRPSRSTKKRPSVASASAAHWVAIVRGTRLFRYPLPTKGIPQVSQSSAP